MNDKLTSAVIVGIITGIVGLVSGLICVLFTHDIAVWIMTNDLISWIATYYDTVESLEVTMFFVGMAMIMSGILGFIFAHLCYRRIRYKYALRLSFLSGLFGVVLLIGLIAWIATYQIRRSEDVFNDRT